MKTVHAPASTEWRRRERRFQDSSGVPKGAFMSLDVLNAPFRTSRTGWTAAGAGEPWPGGTIVLLVVGDLPTSSGEALKIARARTVPNPHPIPGATRLASLPVVTDEDGSEGGGCG
ncbi:MAG: hypothetical protein M3422_18245 [Actinomycetota bacterium]|nr:hypothetical protein [Actinomycetota bacterium]